MLILLDRDGVLNLDREDFIKTPGELKMIGGSARAVAKLNHAGHLVAIVSNQSCVGRGLVSEAMVERIHNHLRDNLEREGGHLDAIFTCFDPPWAETKRRKPGSGMLKEAMTKFRTPAADCIMIGDALRDLQAAASIQVARVLVRTGKGKKTQGNGLPRDVLPVSVYDDLSKAVDDLLLERDVNQASGQSKT